MERINYCKQKLEILKTRQVEIENSTLPLVIKLEKIKELNFYIASFKRSLSTESEKMAI